MRYLVGLAPVMALALAVLGGTAKAGESPVLVELFTSQGCSACPPADTLLGKLAERDDVIALSLHVDYWDYIGWTDRFALPGHTVRQKLYARQEGQTMIYTPQIVVAGRDGVIGHDAMEVMDAIAAELARDDPVRLTVDVTGTEIAVTLTPLAPLAGEIAVVVVTYQPSARIAIDRGENAGRTMTYTNVVTGWHPMGEWDGAGETRMRMALPNEDDAAVLVQSADQGAVLAAARAR